MIEQLQPTTDPYADCRNAIEQIEMVMKGDMWDQAREEHMTPESFLEMVQAAMAGAMAEMGRLGHPVNEKVRRSLDSLPEFERPSLRLYVAGKLGLL